MAPGKRAVAGADGTMTEQGALMVKLPLEPQLGRALLASLELGCAAPMLTAAAMLSVESLFMPERPPALRSPAEEERIKHKQHLLVRPPAPPALPPACTACMITDVFWGDPFAFAFRGMP